MIKTTVYPCVNIHARMKNCQNHKTDDLAISFTYRRCDGEYNVPLLCDFCSFWCLTVNTVDKLQF